MKHETRESWLKEATSILSTEFFTEEKLPEKLKVSCGWASKRRFIGECWNPKASSGEFTEIFICPSQEEPIRVLDILLHELIHAAVGIEHGHKKPFRKLVKQFGLAGKVTATYAEKGTELYSKLEKIYQNLGEYPHSSLKPIKKEKNAKSLWVRLVSPFEPTYKIVISPKSLSEFGWPVDPWGNTMINPENEIEEEESE